jgi:hypothetical protein
MALQRARPRYSRKRNRRHRITGGVEKIPPRKPPEAPVAGRRDDELPAVVLLCPECVAQEFGDA